MALTLSSRDIAAFAELQQILLSPLEYPDTDPWQAAIATSLARLFASDSSLCTLPDPAGGIRHSSRGIDTAVAAQIAGLFAGTRPGGYRFTNPVLDGISRRLAAEGVEVWNPALVKHVTGVSFEDTEWYHEIAVPGGVADHTMAGVSLPLGQGLLAIAFKGRWSELGAESNLALFQLLVPAFNAGLWGLLSFRRQRAALEVVLDQCPMGILVRDGEGADTHRNSALERILGADPEREHILAAAEALARSLVALRSQTSSSPLARRGRVVTSAGSFSLGASYLPPGSFMRRWAVMVTIASRRPILPDAQHVEERFGLTRREAEVTLLLARGASNREIADHLRLSPHTVRHHAEWIFLKLGVHSRKALALRIIGPEAEEAMGPAE